MSQRDQKGSGNEDRALASQRPIHGTAEALRRLSATRDRDAWVWILHRHGADILSAARRILDDEALAEDACQETLLQIRDRAGQFRGAEPDQDASAHNWILRIACNTALHLLRQRRRAQNRENTSVAVRYETVDRAELDTLAKLVRTELAGMPERQRRPLVLHFYAGLNYRQLAAELRCGAGAARVRVHRALRALRERLAVLGVMLTASALIVLLEHASRPVAAAILAPERLAKWQDLLVCSQQAAVNVLADGQFPWAVKAGFTAASALLCGSLAWGLSQKSEQSLPGLPAARIAAQTAPAEAGDAGRTPAIAKENVPESRTRDIQGQAPVRVRVPSRCDAGQEVSKEPSRPPIAEKHAETGYELVSAVAQLRLLRMMQQELNARMANVFHAGALDGHGGLAFTPEQQELLDRLADDQARIAMFAQMLADGMKTGAARPVMR